MQPPTKQNEAGVHRPLGPKGASAADRPLLLGRQGIDPLEKLGNTAVPRTTTMLEVARKAPVT